MKKVLIADDEKALLNALVKKVGNENYEIIEADNGNDASKLALESKPDLMLLDIMMPGKHGIDVYEDVRNTEWGVKTPVIFLTNYSEHPEATKISNKDDNCEYIVKSNSKISDIVELIKKKLK